MNVPISSSPRPDSTAASSPGSGLFEGPARAATSDRRRPDETQSERPAGSAPGRRLLGAVRPDPLTAVNMSVAVSVWEEGRSHFRRDLYVSIEDGEQNIEFLGRVVEGPFHVTSDGSPSAAVGARPGAASENGHGAFHVEGIVELLGQLEGASRLAPTATRPRPEAKVFAFPGERLRRLLGVEGDYYLGHLIGAEAVPVHLRSADKNFLPRNVGIFGTVGSGKSNTMQVLMEEALRAGWAVVAVDVEGEYVRMDEPTDDARMVTLLGGEHGLEPQGIGDFHVYVPASGRSGASAPKSFKVPISALEPEIVADILEFSEGHMRMFEAATRNAASRNDYLYRQGGPGAHPGRDGVDARRPYTLQDLIDGLQESNQSVPLIPRIRAEDLPTAASLRAKLVHLGRSDVLDWNGTVQIPEIPIEDLLVGGRLSVLDVSEADDRSRNIAIAYVLQALFERVVQTSVGDRMPSGRERPPLLVVIEEVHTFVSRATAHRMRAVLDNLQIISRRGRKRWMALALVSQQPNHVPDELFELANTRFMHQMKSESNLNAVKNTTGGVHEVLWSTVSTLGPGQCLLSGSALKNALLVKVRPACSQRMLTQ